MNIIDSKLPIRFLGFGRAWPKKSLSNIDLLRMNPDCQNWSEKKLELMSTRITQEIGFTNRNWAHIPATPFMPDEPTTESLALEATQKALLSQKNVDLFIHGTTTTRRYSGSQAASIMGQLGISCPAYETKAGCSTSLATMHMAYGFLSMGYSNVLVSVAETMSKVIHPQRRDDWFGMADGAATIWIEKSEASRAHATVVKSFFSTQGKLVDLYTTPADLPPRTEAIENFGYCLSGDALALRAHAKEHYLEMLKNFLPSASERQSIDWIVPHQVSRSLTEEVKRDANISGELLWSADRFGNLGGSAVLFTLAEALENKVFKSKDRVLLMSVGGGLSFACQLLEFL